MSTPPKSFVDTLATDPHVNAALKLVPRPPDDWPAAKRKVREAEFAHLRASSYKLAEDARFKERQLRDLVERQAEARLQGQPAIATELQGTIDRLTAMVEAAKAMVEAVPEEAARIAAGAKRRAHLEALEHFRRTLQRRTENEGYTMTAEDGQTLLDLGAAVEADQREQAAELAKQQQLAALVDETKTEARAVLIRAMKTQMLMAAKEGAEALGVKASLYLAFPKTTPPEFLHAYNRAIAVARAAKALGDDSLAPFDKFCEYLDDNGRELLGNLTDQWKRVAMKVAAGD